MSDRVGQQIGNYRLVQHLGSGGFADVYLARQVYLDSPAAIKLLRTNLAQEDLEGFRQEARTLVRLIHPHIVRLLDFGLEGNTPFLVMDYAPNGTLRQRYQRGERLLLDTVVEYVQQIASALQYAHDQKVIHRDIKAVQASRASHCVEYACQYTYDTAAQTSRACHYHQYTTCPTTRKSYLSQSRGRYTDGSRSTRCAD